MVAVTVFKDDGITERIPRSQVLKTLAVVFEAESLTNGLVNVVFTSDARITELNQEFLHHEGPTDVITFTIEEEPLEAEIYVSVDTAREQARHYNVPLHNELLRLAVHGALHLAGHDDATDKQRMAMSELETRYIERSGNGVPHV